MSQHHQRPGKPLAEKSSIASMLADAFVTSRLTVAFILACILIGSWALLFTPRQDNPRIVVPAASITVDLPGATPAEVEALVIRPLEAVIKQVPGVDDVFSTALNSRAMVSVVFKAEENPETALVRLYDRVGSRHDLLPPDASAPVIRSSSVDDVPIVTLTLTSDRYDDYALKRLADRMADGLRGLDDVGAIEVRGGRDREIRVELDPDRMQAFGITLDVVRSMLAAGNVTAPLGDVMRHGVRNEVVLDGFLEGAEGVRHLVVGTHAGRSVHLGDVATIVDGPPDERTHLSRLAFGPADSRFGQSKDAEMPAVTVSIAKKADANAVVVARDVLARTEDMRAAFVPEGVAIVTTRDDGEFANDTINGLIEHLLIAILAVFFVVTVFLGIRQALIVGLAIPLVLALTLGMVWLAGYSINRITLFGLILALGLLVDDAIVVIENIHRNYDLPGVRDKRAATVLATREIGNPTNLATLAVILVFASLVSVPGMHGQYFYPVAFTVPVAMASSLLVAYTVVPWAALRWLPLGHAATSGHGGDTTHHVDEPTALGRRFRQMVAPLIDHSRQRRRVFMVIGLLLAFSLLQPLWQFVRPAGVNGPQSWFGIEIGMMPKDSKNTFNVTIDLPEGSPIEQTDRVAREIGSILRQRPEIIAYQTWLGESGIIDFNGMLRGSGNKSGSWVAEIRVTLNDRRTRDTKSPAIVHELRPAIMAVAARYPGTTVQLVEDPPGPPVRGNLFAEIYGKDPARLREISAQVAGEFRKTWDVVEVADSEPADVVKQRLVVDREKAALSGLTTAEVAIALRRLIDGEYLGRAHMSGELNTVPIRLQIPRRHQVDVTLLSRAFITNAQGRRVPLSELVRVQNTVSDRPIQRKNGERVSYVGGETDRISPLYAVLDMDKRLDGMRLADGSQLTTGNMGLMPEQVSTMHGYRLFWDGQQRQMLDTYRDMLRALAVAITLLFLVLVAYYQSFSLPAVAMVAIPLGLAGVAPGHWIMQQQFSATSIVGVIALAGVVVRNSLLIIDFVLEYRDKGRPLREAILDACAIRLRPIMLTALAIVLGSAVMLTDPLFVGLAISLIFGTIAATVLTLIVIPVLLYLLLLWKGHRAGQQI